jgi:hypothetical protein
MAVRNDDEGAESAKSTHRSAEFETNFDYKSAHNKLNLRRLNFKIRDNINPNKTKQNQILF